MRPTSPLRWILRLMLVAGVIAVIAPASALADVAVTLPSASELRLDSDSQDAENLVITRITDPDADFECAPRSVPCLQLANGPQEIRENVAACAVVTNSGNTVVACAVNVAPSIFLKLDDGDDFARAIGTTLPTITMDGSFGADDLSVDGNGGDTVLGGDGDDVIADDGSSGADTLNGGDGNDTISVGGGNDDVTGGAGGADTVLMGSGDDTVRLDDLANDGTAGQAKNVHTDVEIVDGSSGSDNLFGNGNANTLRGGSGNDLLDGGAGDDVLEGETGADDIAGGADTDRVRYTDSAAQTVTLDDARNDGASGELDNVHSDVEHIAAGAGNDTVTGNGAANVLEGNAGDDRLEGGGGVDTFLGGAGADGIFARDGLAERLECGAENDTGEGDTIDQLFDCEGVALSDELVPDADGDGSAKPDDCDDRNPAIHRGVPDVPENGVDEDCSDGDAVNLDRDGDGFLRPDDCDDGNPRINRGARDIPGNAVNEDCRGGAAPFPVLPSTITTTFDFPPAFTRVTAVTIRRARKGSTLRISCRGAGCPFRSRSRKLKRNRAKLTVRRPLGRARLKRGARFEVRLTKPETVGLVARYTMRSGVLPARKDRCLVPGRKRLSRCPT